MKYLVLVLLYLSLILQGCRTTRTPSRAVPSQSRQDYIERYSSLAISEMKRSGIPASITMAQALLESGDGNSTLARNSNNHFGIKCHNDWKGATYRHDDDRRRECFRKYASVADSYRDHSAFLTGKSRYAFLFELDPNDYKGWSRGLKKAGYATNPKYADLLIKIIEDNELYRLDRGIELARNAPQTGSPGSNHAQSISEDLFEDGFAISSGDRSAGVINRVDYIVTKPGDTFGSLTREYGLMPWELPRYNDLEAEAILKPGWILYLQPKRNQAEQGNQYHIVREGDSAWSISQTYGVKLEKILEMNGLDKNARLQAGDQIWLRKKKMP